MKILIAIIICLLCLSADAQVLQSSGGSISAGSTPTFGFSAGVVPFSDGSKLQASTLSFGSPAGGLALGSGAQSFGPASGAFAASNTLIVASGSNAIWVWLSSDIPSARLTSGGVWGWVSSSTQANGTLDTGISRHATAGVVDIGNGSVGSTAGGIQTGNATLLSLTTGTNADFLCLNSGGGILIQSTACTISSLRFKPDWKPYADNALSKIDGMDVGTFHLQTGINSDPNAQSLQAGLSAESVAAIAPECAIYENDMKTPKSYRQECVIALLVKALQQLKSR